MEAELAGADARLRRSALDVLARMHGAGVHGLYGYLEWLAGQVMPDTAETAFLDRLAGIWGVLRVPASYAGGFAACTGTNGVVVPAGTSMRRADGAEYTTTADATIASGGAQVPVVATAPGAAGNAAAGTSMTFAQPIAGVSSGATVAAGGLTQGADSEGDEALRGRLLARIRQPPMGGAAYDYVAWALEVPGVTRAWCYPLEGGVGKVVVRFVRDGDASFIPDSAEVAAVQAYLDERRPVTAQLTVAAPTAAPINFNITLTPNTVAVQDAVRAELADLLRRVAKPGGTILVSHIREAISVAAGETNHVLNSPSGDVTHTAGQMPTLGTFTWA
jgi:uncharacterized phage protein gp47/JayE